MRLQCIALILMVLVLFASDLYSQPKPNIIWIIAEDMSPRIGAFGDRVANTPTLDKLATEGVIYTNLHSVSGVCAPSRSAIMSGMYPTSIGTQHMRVRDKRYHAVPPPEVKGVSEHLRANGYYCINYDKMDYQWGGPVTMWDENHNNVNWNNRDENQPFFAVFNLMVTHESRIWYNQSNVNEIERPEQISIPAVHAPSSPVEKWYFQRRYAGERMYDQPITDPASVVVPPYYPDVQAVRKDIARHYDNIHLADQQVAAIVEQLIEDKLLDNTIIMFFGDHGDGLPRMKREIYDGGLRAPLIIRYPDGKSRGVVDNQLLSFIDLAPTTLSLAGISPPEYIHGRSFAGAYVDERERDYIYAARDRMDDHVDIRRAVKDKRFKYIKNYYPDIPYQGDIPYRKNMDLMKELVAQHEAGTLNVVQELWFRKSKPEEELYDVLADPYEINNLASDPKYKKELERLRKAHTDWQQKYGDPWMVSEEQMIEQNWPGKIQPNTAEPQIQVERLENDRVRVTITCPTEGASIAWTSQMGYSTILNWPKWKLYTGPIEIEVPESGIIRALAVRYGYQHSSEAAFNLKSY